MLSVLDDPTCDRLQAAVYGTIGGYDRVTIDRWLLLRGFLDGRGLAGYSLLDLGCASGLLAMLCRISAARAVTAVDDATALASGYDGRSTLAALTEAARGLGIDDLEVSERSAQDFVAAARLSARVWDVVLCLGLLHHLIRGYGDQAEVGRMAPDAFAAFAADLGAVTAGHLIVEVDESRVGQVDDFIAGLAERTGLTHVGVLGWSCSAPGRPRRLWTLSRTP